MKKKLILPIVALCVSGISTFAQSNFNTGYFMDNYYYGYRINPALENKDKFFGVLVNNICVSPESNIGISSLLYSTPNGIVTAFNKEVSVETLMNSLKDVNKMGFNMNYSLFSFGGKKKHHDFNFDLNIKAYANVEVPKKVFGLFKVGGPGEVYDMSGTGADIKGYLEAAYGYNRAIGSKWRVGGRAKLLLGLASARVTTDQLSVTLGNDEWTANSDALLSIAAPFINVGTDPDGAINYKFSADPKQIRPSGFGAAVDLGVEYRPIDGLTISASVLDLGAIAWKNNIHARSKVSETYAGSPAIDVDGSDLSAAFDEALEEFKKVAKFTPETEGATKAEMLPWSINLGARYKMPFYDKLSAGLLASFVNYSQFTATDIRVGATVTPLWWLCLNANVGFGSFGSNFGTAITLDFGPVNLFAGAEFRIGKQASFSDKVQMPMQSFHNKYNVGLTFAL